MQAERSEAATAVVASTETDFRKLFVVGCPRSGTTWMQLLLSQFPEVATAPETQIFAYYLDHFLRQWRHEHEGPGSRSQGRAGLSRLLTEDEFFELCGRTAGMVLEKIAAGNPGASVVCEKSPRNALQAEFIHRVFPDAYFLHVIRDPRDTVASLMAAARSWGSGWAPRSAIGAARMWTDHIRSARRIAGRTERYREIRYEALQRDPAGELHGIAIWLGLGVGVEECVRAVEACELKTLQKSADARRMPLPGEKSPKDFFRKGKVGGWQEDVTPGDVRVIEYLCADHMRELGYEPLSGSWTRRPLRVSVHDGIQRVRESVDWQLARLLARV